MEKSASSKKQQVICRIDGLSILKKSQKSKCFPLNFFPSHWAFLTLFTATTAHVTIPKPIPISSEVTFSLKCYQHYQSFPHLHNTTLGHP